MIYRLGGNIYIYSLSMVPWVFDNFPPQLVGLIRNIDVRHRLCTSSFKILLCLDKLHISPYLILFDRNI